MDETTILRLVEVLSSDVSGTMLRDASAAAPNLGTLIHALGMAHAGRIAVECFRLGIENDEQRAMFEALLSRVTESADQIVAMAALQAEAAALDEVPRG